MEETNRRREKQMAWNEANGVKPASIVKKVADIMEAAYPVPGRGPRKAADGREDYSAMSPEQLMKKAGKLEKQMLKAARDLEFEEAARLRDEIARIREQGLGLGAKAAG